MTVLPRIVCCLVVALSLAAAPPRAVTRTATEEARILTDFTPTTADWGWFVVNDTVMGGRSQGGFVPEPDGLRFHGRTNTDGGGFSSIRTRSLALDLAEQAGLRLRVLGDGRRYTWRLTTDARWEGRTVAYWADFETRPGVWADIEIPFSRFEPTFRGRELSGPALDPSRISGMGLMIYDGDDGPFELHLRRVEAYR